MRPATAQEAAKQEQQAAQYDQTETKAIIRLCPKPAYRALQAVLAMPPTKPLTALQARLTSMGQFTGNMPQNAPQGGRQPMYKVHKLRRIN